MAVIKNNINFGNQNIKRIYKGNNQITQIWRRVNNQNKLLYFYGDGSQGLTYEYDDVQKEKTFRRLSTSSKIGFGTESGVLVYSASFSLVVTDTDGTVISIKDAVVTAPSAYEVSTPKITNTTITFTAYARQPSTTIVADVKVTYTVRKNVDSTNLTVTGITEVETPLSPLNIPERTFEFDDQNKIGTVVAISTGAFKDATASKIAEEVQIPSTVETIGDEAFYGCELKKIDIGCNVKSIGRGAFAGTATVFKNVHIYDIGNFCKIDFMDKYANPLNMSLTISRLFKINYDNTRTEITSISTNDLYTSSGGTITLPALFQKCSNITSIEINSGYDTVVKVVYTNGSKDTKWSIPTLNILSCAVGSYFDGTVFSDSFETVRIYFASTWAAYDGDTIVATISPTGPTGTNWNTFFNNNAAYKIKRTQ